MILLRTLIVSIPFASAVLSFASGVVAEPPTPMATTISPEVSLVAPKAMFPVMHRLNDGRLAAVNRGGASHLGIAGRLDMIFSSNEGKTWGGQVVVNDSPEDDRNPAFGVSKSGTLLVSFFRTANYDETGKYNPYLGKPTSTWITRSEDGGKTWQPATPINCAEHGYGSPYGRMVTMPDGTLLMAIYGDALGSKGDMKARFETSYIYRSIDDGRTWKRVAQFQAGKTQFNETAILRTSTGRLIAALRTRSYELWTSSSEDDGVTWSEPKPLAPAWIHPADLLEVPQGVLLLAGNRVGPHGVLGIVGNKSGEFDFAKRFNVVNSLVSRDCGYPSGVVLRDGRVLLLYYTTADSLHKDWPRPHVASAIFKLPTDRVAP